MPESFFRQDSSSGPHERAQQKSIRLQYLRLQERENTQLPPAQIGAFPERKMQNLRQKCGVTGSASEKSAPAQRSVSDLQQTNKKLQNKGTH